MTRETSRSWVKPLVLAVVIAVPSAVLLSYLPAMIDPQVEGEGSQPTMGAGMNTPFTVPGVRTPAAVDADDASAAGLKDDDQVIGIAVGGRFRAYKLSLMAHMQSHVINDLVADKPVTITYCDRTDCTRAFTSTDSKEPLDVWTAGYADGLMLRVGNMYFHQVAKENAGIDAPPGPPLPEYPFERTTWKEWRQAHPDTDVVVTIPPRGNPFRPNPTPR